MRAVFALVLPTLFCAAAARDASAADAQIAWDDLRALKIEKQNGAERITFDPAIAALSGKAATIAGWITPINLGDGTTVTSFLLTGTPGTCPFCFGYGPESFVLVEAAEPVPADVSVQLLLSGRFSAKAEDASGFYYRLSGARIAGRP